MVRPEIIGNIIWTGEVVFMHSEIYTYIHTHTHKCVCACICMCVYLYMHACVTTIKEIRQHELERGGNKWCIGGVGERKKEGGNDIIILYFQRTLSAQSTQSSSEVFSEVCFPDNLKLHQVDN